jgi:hypothetical protein
MRRFITFLLILPTAAAAAVFLITAAWTMRSFYVADGFVWRPADNEPAWTLHIARGGIRAGRHVAPHNTLRSFDHSTHAPRYPSMLVTDGWLASLGISYQKGIASPTPTRYHDLVMPTWPVILLSGSVAVIGSWRLRRRWRWARRAAQSLCQTCGYDLRASGESCPECGAAV